MTMNHDDGQFAIDGWSSADTSGPAEITEYSDMRDDLRDRGLVYLRSGRFAVVDLCRLDAGSSDWELIETLTSEDLDA